MFKGAIHLHSVYSDGEFTLAELREALVADGLSFACLTDHAEYSDRLLTRDYVAECASLSDDRFRFIPGFEHPCYEGMRARSGSDGGRQNAGPAESHQAYRPTRRRLDHRAPEGRVLRVDRNIRRIAGRDRDLELEIRRPLPRRASPHSIARTPAAAQTQMRAYYGVDLHWRQHRGLLNLVRCRSNSCEEILGLRARRLSRRQG